MVILHPWLWLLRLVGSIASDPDVQDKAVELFDKEVKPRAKEVRAKAGETFEKEVKPRVNDVRAKAGETFDKEVKPRVKEVSKKLDAAKADIQQIAREIDPRKNPRKFASKVKQRFLDRKDRR